MSLGNELIQQARHLATREKKRPKQASLRRAISTAYYALFHILVEASTKELLGTQSDTAMLRNVLARAFQHSTMKVVSEQFERGVVSTRIANAASVRIPDDLRDVASAFVELQQARHDADYNLARTFRRTEAVYAVQLVEDARAKWAKVRQHPDARLFLVALLAQDQIRR